MTYLPRILAAIVLAFMPSCSYQRNDDLETLAHAIINYTQNTAEPLYSEYLCDDQKMHSWRVLVVPYLFSNDFFNRYDLKSSWDSSNNSPLQAEFREMVPQFFGERIDGKDFTKYAMIQLDGKAKQSYKGRVSIANQGNWEIVPGSQDSLLVIAEMSNFCGHWMKPSDLTNQELQKDFRDSVRALIVIDLKSSNYSFVLGNNSASKWIDDYRSANGDADDLP